MSWRLTVARVSAMCMRVSYRIVAPYSSVTSAIDRLGDHPGSGHL
jgi:hypothetical protein